MPNFSLMALTSVEPFRSLNPHVRQTRYKWTFLCRRAGPVTASNGLDVEAAHGIADAPSADLTVVVASLALARFRDASAFDRELRLAASRDLDSPDTLEGAGLPSNLLCHVNY